MKSIFCACVIAVSIMGLTINAQATSTSHLKASTTAVSDTGKMKAKKMSKMSKSKMKMAKDTTKKMSKM